jgi:hypothetical protein
MTENNSYDRDQDLGPDPFVGDNILYNSFVEDDIIKPDDDFTFTIEGRPTLKPDKEFEEMMSKAYDEQRRDRLTDCIDDYLNDDDKTAIDLYDDMLASLEETRDYHSKQIQKIDSLIRMIKPGDHLGYTHRD